MLSLHATKVPAILFTVLLACSLSGSARAAEHEAWVRTADGLTLAARVSMPDGLSVRAPAVLLICGSGPNDMDETIPASMTATGEKTKIFKDIADTLVARGYVVFRYNKRGAAIDGDFATWQGSAAATIYATAGLTDFVSDAGAALAALRAEPLVDPARIVLLGHSEGTWIAPALAQRDGHVAGLALMGVMARNLRETLAYQLVDRSRAFAWNVMDANHDGQLTRAEIQQCRAPGLVGIPADDAGLASFLETFDTDKNGVIDRDELETFLQDRILLQIWKAPQNSRWLREHYAATPNLVTLAGLDCPIVILEGLLDEQTIPAEARLHALVFSQRGKKNLDVRFFEGLGHGFSPPIDGTIPSVGPVAPQVLASLAGWMAEHFPSPAAIAIAAAPGHAVTGGSTPATEGAPTATMVAPGVGQPAVAGAPSGTGTTTHGRAEPAVGEASAPAAASATRPLASGDTARPPVAGGAHSALSRAQLERTADLSLRLFLGLCP